MGESCRATGFTPIAALQAVAPEGHLETADAYVRNELLRGARPSSVWHAVIDSGLAGEPRPDVGRRLVGRRGISVDGRLTDDTFCAQVRHQEYLYSIDGVIKSVAYALVLNEFELVAVAGPEIVLSISNSHGDTDTILATVREVIRRAQTPLLGALAAPCECEWRDDW